MLPRRTIIIGGAASGKSKWAETQLENTGKPMAYLATGRIYDGEVAERVKIHKNRRDSRWTTIEAPLELEEALSERDPDEVVLIDCATMWLTNHMMEENDITAAQTRLFSALEACRAPTVVVTNEVGHGIVPDNKLARQFREAQGRLNIALAAQADLVVMVVAGLPLALKGELP